MLLSMSSYLSQIASRSNGKGMTNSGLRELIPVNQAVFNIKKVVERTKEENNEFPFSSVSENHPDEPVKPFVTKDKKSSERLDEFNSSPLEKQQEIVGDKNIKPNIVQPAEQPIAKKTSYL